MGAHRGLERRMHLQSNRKKEGDHHAGSKTYHVEDSKTAVMSHHVISWQVVSYHVKSGHVTSCHTLREEEGGRKRHTPKWIR